jgi:tetratricopeptide (TPR) repeat protein
MARIKSTHVDDPALVGRRLKEARTGAGLSQRQLAYEGCSPAYISRVEAGGRIPSMAILRQLGERLGVSAEWLATGQDEVGGSRLRDAEIALRFDDIDEASRLFSALAERPTDAAQRSQALGGLAEIALRMGEPRRAIELGEEALELAGEQPEDRPALAETLARSYAGLGQFASAIAVLTRCRDHLEDDVLQYVRFSTLLGAALTDAGNFAEAELVIAGALARGRDLVDPKARARLYWSQSRLLVEAGRSEEAEDYARRTLETLRATEDEYSVGLILQTLAHISTDLGRPGDALELLEEARPKIAAGGTPLEMAQYQVEEARALAAVGEHEKAAGLAIELTHALGEAHPTDAGRAYVVLGETFAALGDRARAAEVLELAVELLEARPASRYLVKAYKELAAVYRDNGEPEKALEVLERAIGVQDAARRPLG